MENTAEAKPIQEEDKKRVPRFKKRVCRFCTNKELPIDYKRVDILVRYVSNKGKILPRRLSGNCAKHQRQVAKAIKRARMAGLMPFTVK
ncbi:MAG: 30S ribosomal protein S18 [Candidatus Hydrogenedentota bacterium]|nr:MAG: 30S ribosomal protein S18 [Candidatus Hydrogenedentota bacterium]